MLCKSYTSDVVTGCNVVSLIPGQAEMSRHHRSLFTPWLQPSSHENISERISQGVRLMKVPVLQVITQRCRTQEQLQSVCQQTKHILAPLCCYERRVYGPSAPFSEKMRAEKPHFFTGELLDWDETTEVSTFFCWSRWSPAIPRQPLSVLQGDQDVVVSVMSCDVTYTSLNVRV